MNPQRDRSLKTSLVFLLKLVFVTLLALILWEVTLSNVYFKRPVSVNDPIFGRIPGPGLYVEGKEGFARSHIGDHGLRVMPTFETAPDAKNVLLLGDSFTQAAHVPAKQTFAWLLQEQLGSNYNVTNAGREGSSPNYYLGLSESIKELFAPDVVVIQLNISDFTYDAFDPKQDLYFVRTAQGFELRRNESFVSRSPISTRFDALKKFLNFSSLRLALTKLDGERRRDQEFYAAETKSESELQDDEAAFIDYALKELKATYGDPILVYLPVIDYFDPESAAPDFTEQQLQLATQKAGVRYISMRGEFLRFYQDEHQIATGFANTMPGTGHLNPAGHKLVAKQIYQMITEELAAQ
jgi:lysophospholipase L1-like esterase